MSGIDLDGAEFQTNVIGHGEQLELTAKFHAEATTIDGRNDFGHTTVQVPHQPQQDMG